MSSSPATAASPRSEITFVRQGNTTARLASGIRSPYGPPDRSGATARPRQQTTAKTHDAGLTARIPWHSSAPRCARHGKLSTSGFTDKLKVTNKCCGKIGYKAHLKHGLDSVCHLARKNKS
ncbi:hypothetical protein [Streptomyces rimosus]|uniref:hypothetical protein n=1 Tax=Streptomyces rimosus TaxID=1927 RepID=UPI00131E491D|nr:hypothetical protein [Streptomyces rimosus]